MHDVHPAAAEGFNRGIDTYVRGRPAFPPAALEWLRDDLGLCAGSVAVDLGAGTGKFTTLMAHTGAHVIAVEPSAAMLASLVRQLPAITALRGTAQAIPLADSSADAVVCAQAFHWFASRAALAEIHRVLKPGGVLGLIWNVRDESVEWVHRLDDIMSPYEGDAPRYYKREWRRVFPAPGFGELQEREFVHEHVGPAERVIVDRVASVSFIAALDEQTRAKVLAEVRSLIAARPALAAGKEVRVPYVTRTYWAKRREEA
jgi:SAM-dependent methyltransferase